MKIDYHGKKFKSIANSGTGEVDEATIFHYQVSDNVLTGTYLGGQIVSGHLMGKVLENGRLEFHYHHLNRAGELRSGYCESIPEITEAGRIKLYESWKWLDGNRSSGESIVEEIG